MSDFESLADDLEELDATAERERRVFMMLLDKQREKNHHLFAVGAKMGATRSYVSTVTLEWIAQRVRFANELPMFREHRDPDTGKIILDRETASMIQQREPDWTRQYPMTIYLAKRERHKFPPILVVATQPWVDDPAANEWSKTSRALRDSINTQALDSEGRFQDLHLDESDVLYAIDGQHRLMAIQGLSDLLTKGRLFRKRKDGGDSKQFISVDEIIEQSKGEVSRSDLQGLLAEYLGIEIIPAVQKGETRKEALLRLRSIFVHVNKTAKRLTEGELALLDEDNGFAVVARSVMVNHSLLKGRVELKKQALGKSSPHLTTLDTLKKIATNYLGQRAEFSNWGPDTKSEMPIRPEEESLTSGYERLVAYLDQLQKLPSYQQVAQGKPVGELRDEGNHLLFRPLAQMALAESIGYLEIRKHNPVSLDSIFTTLRNKDAEGAFDITKKEYPWYGVVYDPNKKAMQKTAAAQNLCMRLFTHLLGGGTTDDTERNQLREDFAAARVIDPERAAEEAVDIDGKRVSRALVQLPSPW